jgi:hypothetical protein
MARLDYSINANDTQIPLIFNSHGNKILQEAFLKLKPIKAFCLTSGGLRFESVIAHKGFSASENS